MGRNVTVKLNYGASGSATDIRRDLKAFPLTLRLGGLDGGEAVGLVYSTFVSFDDGVLLCTPNFTASWVRQHPVHDVWLGLHGSLVAHGKHSVSTKTQ